jgi:D-glycero-alpha-D-manno-heptose-7-phosphate kinase
MEKMYNELVTLFPGLGLKVCGAGGGGCFLLIHQKDQAQAIREQVNKRDMEVLDFQVNKPIS